MPERPTKSAAVNVRLPATQYDQVYTKASQEGMSVPEWIRQTIRATLRSDPPRATD